MVSVSDACADERRRMGEIVRKGNTSVSRHGMRVTVSIKIASGKEEGRGYPDLPIMGIRGGRKEAWAEWVEDGTVRGHKSPWRVRCTCPLFSPFSLHEVMLIAGLACLDTDRETSDAWRRD